jgi:hypothetical protein
MSAPEIVNQKVRWKGGKWAYTYQKYSTAGLVDNTAVAKDWIPTGGVVLKNVTHDNYSFAKDIRVVSIWVFPKKTDRFKDPKQLILGAPDFIPAPELKDGPLQFTPIIDFREKTSPLNFSGYNTESSFTIRWMTKDPLFKDTEGASRHLFVTQTFIFTDYNNEPKHEPAGILMATRLMPIVEIFYPDENDGYIDSIRIDYRFHLKLDGALNVKGMKELNDLLRKEKRFDKKFPNQAGVFRDKDSLTHTAAELVLRTQTFKPPLSAIFSAVEKPIPIEICTTGMRQGSVVTELNRLGWDNIHWWGYRGKNQPIISAPGGTHAAHLHWRWGDYIQNLGEQFKSFVPKSVFEDETSITIAGPLADPNCWLQTIRFAITKNSQDLTPDNNIDNLKKLSSLNFSDTFTGKQPEDIEEGEDIVLWYSIQSYKSGLIYRLNKDKETKKINVSATNENSNISGKYFIHGIFFGHEPEGGGFSKYVQTGQRGPEYYPNSKNIIKNTKKWDR